MSEAGSIPPAPEGWYPVADGASERYWDGAAWTNATRAARPGLPEEARVVSSSSSLALDKRVVAWIVLAAGLLGGALACFTQVSLLSGTGTVWVGVVIAMLALVVCAVARLGRVFLIVLAIVVALALSAAIYDEVQLSHKRHELSHLFND